VPEERELNTFVTGGTGFIGGGLVRALVDAGQTVHLLARRHSDLTGLDHEHIKIFHGDVTDKDSLATAMAGCGQVFHLAGYARNWARDPAVFFEVNVVGFRNAAEVALGLSVERFVLTSTCMTFGPTNGDIFNEEMPRRTKTFLTEYERTKYLAELEGDKLRTDGLPLVVVNPTRVYGPGKMTGGNSVTRMADMYRRGKFPVILGKGVEIGNYVHVDDVVDAHVKAMSRGKVGEKYLLAGENCSLNEFFALLSQVCGKRPPRFHLPATLAKLFAHLEGFKAKLLGKSPFITPGWVETFLRNWAFSNEKAVAELGCKFRPLKEGLKGTINWLMANG
jgi:nucleoside-diphosphate-sugar epimerase